MSAALVAGALTVLPTTPVAAADVVGSTFTPTSPVRVLDTRVTGPVGAGGTVAVDLASRVPASATAVVLNVTGVAPSASTFVTAYPGGSPRPTASNLNLDAGETRANQVTVALGADRTVRLYNHNGRTNLVADLAGHYGTEAGSLFTGLSPNRVLDTRSDHPVGPGGVRVLDLSGAVPASATAVTFTLTATRPTASTYVTAWPTGTPRPTASNLNVEIGETRPNLVTVALGADRKVSLYNNFGNIHLVADLTGFYTPGYGSRFVPRAPERVLDTRVNLGLPGPLGTSGLGYTLDLSAATPVNATGLVLNVTGVGATTPTYVTAWGQGMFRPEASTVNLVPGKAVPSAATVAFNQKRGIDLYNHSGTTHVVADLSGMFVVPPADCGPDCLRAWGLNDYRKLGIGQTVETMATPSPVVGLSGVRQVAGGGWGGASYALLADGTVRAWGANGAGQLGNGWSGAFDAGSPVPVPVVGLDGVTALATNGMTTYALRSDGTVWGWGAGPFGTGDRRSSTVPVPLPHLTGVTEIAVAERTTFALRPDGTVWSWGGNALGELGTGSPDDNDVLTPVRITALSDVVSIGAGTRNGYAVTSGGAVQAWGQNALGQLGNGETCPLFPDEPCLSRVPVQVTGLDGVARVVGDAYTAYALRTDGTVAAWGYAYNGALGNGVPCEGPCVARTPVEVAGLTDVTAVASYGSGGYALRADGTVWAWGDNWFRSLGNDTMRYALSPVQVPGLTGISAISGGANLGYAVS